MAVLDVVVTVVVLLAVAAAILLFERPRARRIERDLRDGAAGQGGPLRPPNRREPPAGPRPRE